jgi:type IV pilus assembly protein PilC
MATFVYEALDAGGRQIRGNVEADSQAAGIAKLQGLNYTVVRVTERTARAGLAAAGGRKGKVKLGALVVFSRQFATMINAGISVVKCLDILEGQCRIPS